MRKLIVTLVAVISFGGLLFGTADAQVIHLDKTNVNFGKMNQHEIRETKVIVSNNGGGLLKISEVKADCGCTVPTLSKKELGPGESTTIDIHFDSKEFHGNVLKVVHIFSNDPNNPDAEFTLQANVFAPILIDPPRKRVGFDPAPYGETFTKRVTFTATEAPKLELRAEHTRKGLFEVNIINNLDGNPQVSALEVTVPRELPAGRQTDVVRVYTNLEAVEHVDIDMQAWPMLALSSSQDQLNFRYKKKFDKIFIVYPYENQRPFKITGVECDLPEIQVKVAPNNSKSDTKIIVTGAPISKDDPRAIKNRGRISGKILIHCDMEELPVLEIPVSYMIRM